MAGTKIYGIVAAENPDNVGETIILDGLEDRLKFFRDEHDELSSFRVLGAVTYSKKIKSPKDCENEKQLRCWNHAGVPLLYAEGTLFDNEDHPNAKAAAAILKYCNNNPGLSLQPGLSVDGEIHERVDAMGNQTRDKSIGKKLTKTVAISGAFTVQPCNPKCAGALFIDEAPSLQKSTTPPKAYVEALKKSQSSSSFNEIPKEVMLLHSMQQLHKSLEILHNDHASIQCYHCGKAERFFKSSGAPNTCLKCGKSYTIKQVWESFQKKRI
jgi:predicted nucleic-acid-binding Zn-ribbon protein